jgi:glyoxylase-like metal-dependent hydrolase (beta-lactamase superfamily II)
VTRRGRASESEVESEREVEVEVEVAVAVEVEVVCETPLVAVHVLALRTPTLLPATDTNLVVIASEGEALVIEPATPYEDERERMLRFLDDLARADGTRPVAIALTHHHPDHVGAAAWLRERLDVPLLAHPRTQQRLEGQVAIDRTIDDGEQLEVGALRIDVLHTPGHAPGHACFFDASTKTLVAGDMVAGTGTILVEKTDGDMGLYLASLERMQTLDAAQLIPAHGPTLGPEVLPRYVAHRRAREAKIVDALRTLGGAGTIDDLVPLAYADTPPAVWPIARMSTEAHLLHLALRGEAHADHDRWALASRARPT